MSYEHEISIVSAITLKDIFKREKIYIFCDAHREFYLIPESEMKSKLFSSGGIASTRSCNSKMEDSISNHS